MIDTVQQFDYSVNLLRALLWQDNRAAKLTSILQQEQTWFDTNVNTFWTDWVTDVFDLRTANDFGLAVWAIILGIQPSVVLPPSDPGKPTWGFGSFNMNFNNGNFSNQQSSTALLTQAQKRIFLQLRYFRLTCRPTVPFINRGLKSILGDQGSVYVLDANDMSFATYVFGFAPNSALAFVLENFDILPRPAAVGSRYIVATRPTWGFDAPTYENFDNGTFLT